MGPPKRNSNGGKQPPPLTKFRLVTELLTIAAIIAGLIAARYLIPRREQNAPEDWSVAVLLAVMTLVVVVANVIALVRSRHTVWQSLPPAPVKWLACCDTLLVSLAFVVFACLSSRAVATLLTVLSFSYAVGIPAAHLKTGLHVSIRELLAFYTSISLLDVMTGRAPHERIHPRGCDHGPWPDGGHYKILNPLDVIGYFFVLVPMLASTALVKSSFVLLFPILHVGLSFDASDYTALSHQAKLVWRSSFKTLGIGLSCLSIGMFLLKAVVYLRWNEVVRIWNTSVLCQMLERPFAPTTFYPWHLTLLLNAILHLFLMKAVDRTVHLIDDRGFQPTTIGTRLKFLLAGFRARTVLSLYNWICFLWVIAPWLSGIHFPPVTWQLFPK